MSCSLVLKADWLEFSNGSSLITKLVYLGLIAVGIALFIFELEIERKLSVECLQSGSLKTMLRLLQIFAILLTILPISFFFIDYASTGMSFIPPWMINAGIGIVAIVAIIIVILTAAIQIETAKKCPEAFSTKIWFPSAIILVASLALAFYRWKTNSAIKIKKQNVNWQQISQNALLIESIGTKQARQCGITLEKGASVAAFQYYLKQRQQEFENSTNAFSRLFKRPEQLPKDKMPNIVKMFTRFEQDFQLKMPTQKTRPAAVTQQEDAFTLEPNVAEAISDSSMLGNVASASANAINYGLSSVGSYIGSYFK